MDTDRLLETDPYFQVGRQDFNMGPIDISWVKKENLLDEIAPDFDMESEESEFERQASKPQFTNYMASPAKLKKRQLKSIQKARESQDKEAPSKNSKSRN